MFMPPRSRQPSPIGLQVYKHRRRLFLTQQQLARRSGLSAAVVQGIEQGVRLDPRLSTVEKLAAGLGVPIAALLDRGP